MKNLGVVKIKKDHEYKTALKGEEYPLKNEGRFGYYIETPGMVFHITDMEDQNDIFDLTNIKI